MMARVYDIAHQSISYYSATEKNYVQSDIDPFYKVRKNVFVFYVIFAHFARNTAGQMKATVKTFILRWQSYIFHV